MDPTTADTVLPVAVARAKGEGPALNVLGSPYIFKATSAETGNRFCCLEHAVPPGSGVPAHTHTHEDEFFYVLAGEVTFDSADRLEPLQLGAGGSFFSPRGQQHAFRNAGSVEARMLVCCMPGAGIERMFRELHEAGMRAGGGPDMAEIVAITERAGVKMAQPPET
jgi:mannose-6-phosphate isomerase-like protein (cupin superfamily)